MNLPKAKIDNILVQDLENELLIYNLTTHKAYTLNETSKIIFNSCDGATPVDELKRKYKFTDDLIYLALDELQANDLLKDYQSVYFAGLSRREVIRRVALSSMIALPVISSLLAPTAAMARSTGPNLCEEVECPYAQDQCHFDGECDPATGDCISRTRPNGTPCDDGDITTTGDACFNGECIGKKSSATNRRFIN